MSLYTRRALALAAVLLALPAVGWAAEVGPKVLAACKGLCPLGCC